MKQINKVKLEDRWQISLLSGHSTEVGNGQDAYAAQHLCPCDEEVADELGHRIADNFVTFRNC